MSAITNPLVNSYKRLVSGYDAPVHIAWDPLHPDSLLRIPQDKGAGKRIALRSPDSAANPYLALALCLRAGLDGISRQMMPPEGMGHGPVNGETDVRRIRELPGTLIEALHEMEQDDLVREVLGDYAFDRYLELKHQEWNAYKAQVSAWELEQYLSRY